MKITIEHYDGIYTAETSDALSSDEAIEVFTRLLINCGYPPSIIRLGDGGSYVYLMEDEKIVKKGEDE